MLSYTIIRSNRLNSFPVEICKNAKVVNMFANVKGIDKVLLELYLFSHFKIPDKYFNEELCNDEADVLIVFDGHARPEFLKWLVSANKKKRYIFWCWNTVNEIENNLRLTDIPKEYEIWSYSEYDCKKYNLRYNSTFYWKAYSEMICDNQNYDSDIFFIGKDKGRYEKIKRLETQLTKEGVSCNFQIAPTHPWHISFHYSKKIPYSEVINNIKKTKAILDITVTDTAGPTLRSIEASFYKKKLITDDIGVIKMRFYNSDNIYILKKGFKIEELKRFLESPLSEVNELDLLYYQVDNWLLRFE